MHMPPASSAAAAQSLAQPNRHSCACCHALRVYFTEVLCLEDFTQNLTRTA